MSRFRDASFSGTPTDDSSNLASSSSTPPTTVADSASLHSDTSKHDVITVADDAVLVAPEPAPELAPPLAPGPVPPRVLAPSPAKRPEPEHLPGGRARRPYAPPVYNLAQLSGTAGHGKRRANGHLGARQPGRRRRHTAGEGTPSRIDGQESPPGKAGDRHSLGSSAALRSSSRTPSSPRAPRPPRPPPRPCRTSTRLSAAASPSSRGVAAKPGRKTSAKATARLPLEMRRLQDTKEFAHRDDGPVVYTVWANGKYVDPHAPAPPPAPRNAAVEEPEEASEPDEAEPVTNTKKRRVKKHLDKGLYAGQQIPADLTKGLTVAERKKLAQLPELAPGKARPNPVMPPPLYTGFRLLIGGRDFKLPFHVCNPLPPGQPKPDEWKKMTKNRFIGDSKDYWRKSPHFHDYSKCVCRPEDGCGESCQNRIMLYECDERNCNVGKHHCTNRAFADLAARRSKGGKYRVGVEVIKTPDRGYGVRSNRCFSPNQIIMEYAGEIITEEECERRMTEVYKHNECYYLMSFDQNMIIDATSGSIARFVNHSCNPNCRMIKWIVSGQPRMALFAGDKPIMTGDELTYDYNFDPFSAKNVQRCLCGESNCRGVLGPRSREAKPMKADLKTVVKAKAGKRKIKELVGDEREGPDAGTATKKRRLEPVQGAKRRLSAPGLGLARGAAAALKKSVSAIKLTGRKATTGAKSPVKRGASTGALRKKTTTERFIIQRGRGAPTKKTHKAVAQASQSSLTIVALGDGSTPPAIKTSPRKRTPTKKAVAAAEELGTKTASRKRPL